MRAGLVVALLGLLLAACGDEAPAGDAAAAEAEDGAKSAEESEAEAERPRCPEPREPLARRMTATISEVCAQAAKTPTERDPKVDFEIVGTWKGEYDGDGMDSPVTFEVSLLVTEGVITGSSTEPNTFGYGYYGSELSAEWTGDVYASGQVVLLKTYRSGAVDHSVLYQGTLRRPGRIEGTWRLSGSHGTFRLDRQ